MAKFESTYGKLAERVCSKADANDLSGTTGDYEKCGLQDSEAKRADNQRVLHTHTPNKAAKGGPEEEDESLGVLDGLPESMVDR